MLWVSAFKWLRRTGFGEFTGNFCVWVSTNDNGYDDEQTNYFSSFYFSTFDLFLGAPSISPLLLF